MTPDEINTVLKDVVFEDYVWLVKADPPVLRAAYKEEDAYTGRMETQVTRPWPLWPSITRSQVVNTAFKCVMTSVEHRARERFKYKGQLIFGPHFDVDVLANLAKYGTAIDHAEGTE